MNSSKFDEIRSDYKTLLDENGINRMRLICKNLHTKHSDELSLEALTSLVAYEYRKAYYCFQHTDAVIREKFDELFSQWKSGQCVLEIATQENVHASMLVRAFALYIAKNESDPERLVQGWMNEDPECPDSRLVVDIFKINIHDPFSGRQKNLVDKIKGEFFERKVRSFLESNQIHCLSEESGRAKKRPVTPDFVFDTPKLAIKAKNGSITLYRSDMPVNIPEEHLNDTQKMVVSWIECKAMFGSLELQQEHYRKQIKAYNAVFGEGMVIYLYGYVEPEKPSKNFMLVHQFPQIVSFEPKPENEKVELNAFNDPFNCIGENFVR